MKTRIFVWVVTALFVLPLISFGQTDTKEKPKKTEEIKIQTNLHCTSCKEKIETELASVKGVKEAVADVDTKIVTVKFSPKKTSADVIVERIQKLGYQAKVMGGCCSGKQEGGGCKGSGGTEGGNADHGCGGHH
jgi:copper chaperone CopZ